MCNVAQLGEKNAPWLKSLLDCDHGNLPLRECLPALPVSSSQTLTNGFL